MPTTVNLSVGSGETKNLTFNCGGTFVTDDIQFVITGSGGSSTDTDYVIVCNTAAGTAAKTGTTKSSLTLSTNHYYVVHINNSNTVHSALTLSVNGGTAATIYINGSVSSSSNYTLPAGSYIAYYNGTGTGYGWYFNTDGKVVTEGVRAVGAITNAGLWKTDGGSITLSNNTSQFLRGDGQWAIPSGGGGSDNTFRVTFTINGTTISCDHTIAEIYTAYTSGKIILGGANYPGGMNLILHDCSSTVVQFLQYETTGGLLLRGTHSGNTDTWVRSDKTNLYTVIFSDAGNNQFAASSSFGEIAEAIKRTEPIIIGRLEPNNPLLDIRDYILTFHSLDTSLGTHTIRFTSYINGCIYEMVGEATYSNDSYNSESWTEVSLGVSGGGGGGGDTVTGKTVTLSTTGQAVIQVNGSNSGSVSLPSATNAVAGVMTLGASGGAATYSHNHGSITSGGAILQSTTIGSNDSLCFTDSSDSSKIKASSIKFGSSTTTFLRNDGTWATPAGGGGGGGTHYEGMNVLTNSSSGITNYTNGNVGTSNAATYLNHVENSAVTTGGSLRIQGSGNTAVSANDGVLTISSGYGFEYPIQDAGQIIIDTLLFEDESASYMVPELGALHLPVVYGEPLIPINSGYSLNSSNEYGDFEGFLGELDGVGGHWSEHTGAYSVLDGHEVPSYALTVCLPKILEMFMREFITFCDSNGQATIDDGFRLFFKAINEAVLQFGVDANPI